MRPHRLLTALLALAPLLPAAASAQEPAGVYRIISRGMLGFYSEPSSPNASERVVIDVVPESPAQRAGLVKGDVLVHINGRPATQRVMSEPFQPGDTVVLRVRRDGRERDITVVAAERPAAYTVTIPDSIDRRISIIMDRVRTGVDTIRAPNIFVRRLGDDSSTTIIIGSDTMHVVHGSPSFRFQQLHPDSIRGFHRGELPRMLPDSFAFHLFSDSGAFRMRSDSAALRIFSNADGRVFSYGLRDSAFVRPFDILTTNTIFGMRAVAGAELAPLNAELGQYFGTEDGVLVIQAANGTPAARAGLRGGDVIVQVNGAAVRSIADLRRGIDRAGDGSVSLRVVRRGSAVNVTLDRD